MFGLLDVSDNFKSLNHIIISDLQLNKLYFTVVVKKKNSNINSNPQNLVSAQLKNVVRIKDFLAKQILEKWQLFLNVLAS